MMPVPEPISDNRQIQLSAPRAVVSPDPVLAIRNLRAYYFVRRRVIRAVDDVSITLGRGEILGIAGESGSGKTTLALSLMRLLPKPRGRIVSGEIVLNGRNLTTCTDSEVADIRGKRVAMVFQDATTSLDPAFRVGDQLTETLRRHERVSRRASRARARDLLSLVGIPDPDRRLDAYPHELSGGMQQRVMIAIALACEPDVLIADNPTTALDVTIQLQILALVRELRDRLGMAVLWITHDLGVVARLCDNVCVMYAGRIIESGPTAAVLRSPKHPYTQGLIRALPRIGDDVASLVPIPGRHPDPAYLPEGCPFHPRCDRSMDVCRVGEVDEKHLKGGHDVRCWLY